MPSNARKDKVPEKRTAIGLFGGTFNPVHLGHLHAATKVAEAFGLDRVLFIPSYIPPHKSTAEVAPAEDRFRMVELACRESARFRACDIEVRAREKSYSILTVGRIAEVFPGARLFFILGIDAFLEIGTWFDYEQLLEKVRFIVTDRPGYDLAGAVTVLDGSLRGRTAPVIEEGRAAGELNGECRVFPIKIGPLAVSSTDIRNRARRGEGLDGLVPPAVSDYIMENKLYSI